MNTPLTSDDTAHPDDRHLIRDLAQLEALYGTPSEGSLLKELPALSAEYRAFIEASPFVVLATHSPEGLDASPRGDPAGVVTVRDAHTLLLPDRRGNKRIDSLRNVLADGRVTLLFMVPGVGETLRVNGRAKISVDPALRQELAQGGQPAVSVLIIHIEAVFFQCARALIRSALWNPATWPEKGRVPTAGRMLGSASKGRIDGDKYDSDLPERQQSTLY